jgi:hypothetical protein
MKSVRIPDRKTERAVALALFAADPTCTNCKRAVEKIEHSTVLFFIAEGGYRLLHSWGCTLDAITQENERLSRVSPYAGMIQSSLDRQHLPDDVMPNWIEAWMRVEYPTLDHLTPAQFDEQVRIAFICIQQSTAEQNAKLSASFGFPALLRDEFSEDQDASDILAGDEIVPATMALLALDAPRRWEVAC